MADTILTVGPGYTDQLLTSTFSNYSKVLEDNIFTTNPFWFYMNQKGRKEKQDGGATIIVPLMYGQNATVDWYDGYDQLDTTAQDGLTQAQFQWRQLGGSVSISRRQERQNSTTKQILNLLKTKTLQLEESMIDKFGAAIYTVTPGSNEMESIAHIVDSSGTVGQINGGTYTWWASTETVSGSFAAQGLKDMRTLYNTLTTKGRQVRPDLILTTQSILEYYEAELQPQQRFQSQKVLDGGFENFMFKNATMMFDENCNAGILYMLNTKYLALTVDTQTDMIATPFVKPANQDAKVAQYLWMGNLTTGNRRKHGKLTTISE